MSEFFWHGITSQTHSVGNVCITVGKEKLGNSTFIGEKFNASKIFFSGNLLRNRKINFVQGLVF
jgi:hypothetical protein